jgi:hypothetical protein
MFSEIARPNALSGVREGPPVSHHPAPAARPSAVAGRAREAGERADG